MTDMKQLMKAVTEHGSFDPMGTALAAGAVTAQACYDALKVERITATELMANAGKGFYLSRDPGGIQNFVERMAPLAATMAQEWAAARTAKPNNQMTMSLQLSASYIYTAALNHVERDCFSDTWGVCLGHGASRGPFAQLSLGMFSVIAPAPTGAADHKILQSMMSCVWRQAAEFAITSGRRLVVVSEIKSLSDVITLCTQGLLARRRRGHDLSALSGEIIRLWRTNRQVAHAHVPLLAHLLATELIHGKELKPIRGTLTTVAAGHFLNGGAEVLAAIHGA